MLKLLIFPDFLLFNESCKVPEHLIYIKSK